jgi:hypothetical protein
VLSRDVSISFGIHLTYRKAPQLEVAQIVGASASCGIDLDHNPPAAMLY